MKITKRLKNKLNMSVMLCNCELLKCKREKQLSILCARVASDKLFYQATPLMCELQDDSIIPPSKQESFSKSSFPAGLGEALNCIYRERDFSNNGIMPSDLTLKMTSLLLIPYPTQRGFTEKNWLCHTASFLA